LQLLQMSSITRYDKEIVKGIVAHFIKGYVQNENENFRTQYSNLIRDILFKRGILSDNPEYKQERDAFLMFLNIMLFEFIRSGGNADWGVKAEFLIRIAAAGIIEYLYVHVPIYRINRNTAENRRYYIFNALRYHFRDIINDKYLFLYRQEEPERFLELQRYEEQVIKQTREQYHIALRALYAQTELKKHRNSIDTIRSTIQHLDEAKAYNPEYVTLSQEEIEKNILPKLRINNYDNA
jgi:hypothetical protein